MKTYLVFDNATREVKWTVVCREEMRDGQVKNKPGLGIAEAPHGARSTTHKVVMLKKVPVVMLMTEKEAKEKKAADEKTNT